MRFEWVRASGIQHTSRGLDSASREKMGVDEEDRFFFMAG